MNNCGHLSSRLDGIECEECGFLCCRRCIREGSLCEGCKSEDVGKNARILQFDPNSQKCKKCNKTCKMISSERVEKTSVFGCIYLFLIGLGGGLSNYDGKIIYYKTHHKCRKCNLEFYKEVDKLKNKVVLCKVKEYNPNSHYKNITE